MYPYRKHSLIPCNSGSGHRQHGQDQNFNRPQPAREPTRVRKCSQLTVCAYEVLVRGKEFCSVITEREGGVDERNPYSITKPLVLVFWRFSCGPQLVGQFVGRKTTTKRALQINFNSLVKLSPIQRSAVHFQS